MGRPSLLPGTACTPLLVRRSAWADYPEGELPVIEGTVIRLQVDLSVESAAVGDG